MMPHTMKTSLRTSLLALAALTFGLSGCMRGGTSSQPPVHLVQDMDFQPKLRPQSKTSFEGWQDNRSMRMPVSAFDRPIVVPYHSLPDPKLAHKDANDKFVTTNPLPLTMEVLERGRQRFDIHCAVCHGYSGQGGGGPGQQQTGHGLVGRRWSVTVPNFHAVEGGDATTNRVALLADGEYFDVMSIGRNTMPAYGARISVEDRWAIVHYIRALQQLSKKP
jgi:hypothetical protein